MKRDRRRERFLLLLLLLLWAAPGAIQAQLPPDTPEVLRAGDLIQIEVWRQEEFSGEFAITASGSIAHPLYRTISAANRPIDDVEAELREFLTAFEANPNFVVDVLFRVAVGGEVREPSIHTVRPGATVAEVVAMTGGITERGRLDHVLLRRGGEAYRLDLTDPQRGLRDVTVRSGDEIVVERRRDVFRDYIAPVSSVLGAVLTLSRVLNLF